MIGEDLGAAGFDVEVRPAAEVRSLDGVDAVIVAGAVYANRWHRDARRLVRRQESALRERPVWLVSSGPLGRSAHAAEIPPVHQVARIMSRIGARGHVTFGGRLEAGATGFPARAMAAKLAGDWRDPEQVRHWAASVAGELSALDAVA
jgi:menaquinone-dependent protoporphyrinogen oxidase